MRSGRKRMRWVGWFLGLVMVLSVSLPLSAQVNLTGTWRGTQVDTPQTEPPVPIDVTFTQSGTSLTGRITFPEFGGFSLSGTVSGSAIFFNVGLAASATINYSGTIALANTITGTWVIPEAAIQGTFRLDRVVAPPPPVPSINSGGVINNASYNLAGTSVAPGSIAAVFGTNLTDGTFCFPPSCSSRFVGDRLYTMMSGAIALINGIAAPLFYTAPSGTGVQMGVQIPAELTGTSASIVVTVGGQASAPQTLSVESFAPGIFTVNQNGQGAGAITHASGTLVNPQNPALPNEVVIIYATGLGQVTPAVPTGALPSGPTQTLTRPTVTADGIPAEVQFSGLSGCCVGLNQINVRIPGNVRLRNDIPMVLSIGGRQSNTVTVAVGATPGTLPPNISIRTLAIDPSNPATLYAGAHIGGIFKSSTGGASWSASSSGLPGTSVYILVIDPANPATIYAGSNPWVFKSNNGGASWSPSNSGLPGTNVYALALDPANPATLYAGTTTVTATGVVGGVFKSSNGGVSWSASYSGLTTTGVFALALDPVNPATLYAGTFGGGVFKSNNGGASWSASNSGLTENVVTALAIDRSNPATLYAGTTRGVFKSSNGGVSWSVSNSGLPTAPNAGTVNALAIDPSNPATLYAGTGAGVFKSSNGGANWSASNSGLTNTIVDALAIDPSNPATLYAGTNGSGVFKSTNGGQSWQPAGR